MYLARFRTSRADVVQGSLRLSTLSPELPAPVRHRWADAVRQLAEGLLSEATHGASAQIVLTPGDSLERTLTACVEAAAEPRLRRALGAFSRLETILPGSAHLPLDRTAFDTAAERFPSLHTCVSAPRFCAGEAWVACDFRLGPSVGSLLAEADRYGYRLGYHCTLQPATAERAHLRAARLNQLTLAEVPGAPQALVATQQAMVDRLGRARWTCREYVGVDDDEGAAWIQDALGRLFRKRFAALGFATAPVWTPDEAAFDEEIACPACISEVTEVEDLCATAVEDEEATGALAWEPPEALARAAAAPPPPPGLDLGDDDRSGAQLPEPFQGEGPYVFVSYGHADAKAVLPVVRSLQSRGWNLWYDRGIPGGAEWAAVLEERLASSRAVLLFLSQAAVASKYVRAEISFADSIDKPIVGVQVGKVRLAEGLALTLGHRQLLRQSEPELLPQLERALTSVAGN